MKDISTHYLTQRQTVQNIATILATIISTHYLTQRQTAASGEQKQCRTSFQLTTSHRGRPCYHLVIPPASYFNSLPHTEVDAVAPLPDEKEQYFNSLPHTEVDLDVADSGRVPIISTHYLTQRQTAESFTKDEYALFQLTTSHRGRQ